MGLSSSQARLLSLTGRMHDIEYKAQNLQAQKLQMANESRHVYQEYENALNATKIQLKQINTDGSIGFIDATYNTMKAAGYTIKFGDSDKVIVTEAQESHFLTADGNKNYFIALENNRPNPYSDGYTEVFTAAQLITALASTSSKIRLMSDIDLSTTPITPKNFSGTFDGNGYTIKGLSNNLFNSISGTVKNLKIENANISNSTARGILANNIATSGKVSDIYISNSSIHNSTTSSSALAVGGLVGSSSGTINNCSLNNITVTSDNTTDGSNANTSTGGFIGKNSGSINNCSVGGNSSVSAKNTYCGGFAGCTGSTTSTLTSEIKNSSTTANVKCTQSGGGFVGVMTNSYGNKIESCSASGNVTTTGDYAGGFVGIISYFTNVQIIKCTATGNTEASRYASGFAAAPNAGDIVNCDAFGKATVTDSGATGVRGAFGFTGDDIDESSTPIKTLNVVHCYADPSTGLDFCHGSSGINPPDSSAANYTDIQATPNNNVIIVVPPNIVTTTNVTDDCGAGPLFDQMNYPGYLVAATTPESGHEDDPVWFKNMLELAQLFLFKTDSDGTLFQVNVATDTNLQEVSDETLLKKAEAKYEASMRQINNKDKKFDTDLAALDNERNAIKTEMETLKTVAKDNVDRTFKLFS